MLRHFADDGKHGDHSGPCDNNSYPVNGRSAFHDCQRCGDHVISIARLDEHCGDHDIPIDNSSLDTGVLWRLELGLVVLGEGLRRLLPKH
jgi:hypothetical protein